MNIRLVASALLTAIAIALTGCGGGGGGGGGGAPGGGSGGSGASVNAQNVAFASITVNGPPVVTFTVKDSAGNPVTGLTQYSAGYDGKCGSEQDNYTSNIAFAIAKYQDGNWQNLISLKRSSGNPHNAIEGTIDPLHSAAGGAGAGTLSYNATDKTYTYTFGTNVTDAAYSNDTVNAAGTVMTNGNVAVKDSQTIHRLAMQLCYVDPVTTATVKLNPYIDFTLNANGNDVPFKDAQGKLKPAVQVVDRASCNECHVNFAWHDGNRVDPQYCVMCHNPGSMDFATGNPIDFKLMVHKFHMGKRLKHDYTVQSDSASAILYPQDQRNCVKCHTNSASADPNVAKRTPQGDNWKSKASKNACWACHDDYKDPGSAWQTAHAPFASLSIFFPSVSNPDDTPDSTCQSCHNDIGQGGIPTNAKAHEIPEWVLSENYELNIWAITKNSDNSLTVRYSVSNPKTGSDYDLLDPALASRFSSLSLLFGWNTTDYTNDGGPGRGQPFSVMASTDGSMQRVGGSNRFTITSPVLPADATGTVAVAFQGPINESGLRVPVANVVRYFAMSGVKKDRRQVVSADKCNACHGRFIGYASLITFNPGLGAHDASSNDPQVCVICHNGNNPLDGTIVTGGVVTQYAESADFKRFIHLVHANQGENYPVWPNVETTTHLNSDIFSGLRECEVCHVNGSFKQNLSTVGTSVTFNVDTSTDSTNATVTDTDASDNLVISPKASTCSSCHNSNDAKDHMIQTGGAAFGTVTQGQLASGQVFESCDSCHQPGGLKPVDSVHLGSQP